MIEATEQQSWLDGVIALFTMKTYKTLKSLRSTLWSIKTFLLRLKQVMVYQTAN